MKRMDGKESLTGISWLIVLAIACWGGLVRYLIDIQQSKATWSWLNAVSQIVVSGFTGVLGGLIGKESAMSDNMVFAAAGICGAMGSIALTFFWNRLTGTRVGGPQ